MNTIVEKRRIIGNTVQRISIPLILNINKDKQPEQAKYGYCQYCGAPLQYNPSTDEIYCPVCGVVYEEFVSPHMEVKHAQVEAEQEDLQIHQKIRLQDKYAIDSDIRKKHLSEATDLIKRAAEAVGLSKDDSVTNYAVDLFARFLKAQKTRSDNLEITAYAAFLVAARKFGYTITEETLLSALKKELTANTKKMAKQIRTKRREIIEKLKVQLPVSAESRLNQPIKLLELYRSKFSKVPILVGYEGAILHKIYELWNKAKYDLSKLNKTAKSIATALTYVAAILVLPPEKRIRIRQFDIADIFQTTPITIREILPVLMKHLTPEEQKLVKSCMRRGRRSTKLAKIASKK